MNEEKEITKDTFPTEQKVSVLAGLPEYLKDPANYPKIQKVLLETIASKHSHGDIIEWGGCVECQRKMHDHGEMVRKLGFTSPAQYYAWKKVHQQIEEHQLVKLRKYNDG